MEVKWYKNVHQGIPCWLSGKESTCQGRRQVLSLIWDDPTCHGPTKPLHHTCWAWALEPWAEITKPTWHNSWSPSPLQAVVHNKTIHCNEKPVHCTPCLPQLEKSPCSNKDPVQPKKGMLKTKMCPSSIQIMFILFCLIQLFPSWHC